MQKGFSEKTEGVQRTGSEISSQWTEEAHEKRIDGLKKTWGEEGEGEST